MSAQDFKLSDYSGKVLLIVNVASECGLTPQYEALEEIYEKYRDRGFSVIAFPANEFGAQEPGTDEQIQQFCQMHFGIKFPVMKKIVVKGEGIHPLYQHLTSSIPVAVKKPDSGLEENLKKHGLLSGKPGEILWNFEKFLISKEGKVVARFAPDVVPDDELIINEIEKQLGS